MPSHLGAVVWQSQPAPALLLLWGQRAGLRGTRGEKSFCVTIASQLSGLKKCTNLPSVEDTALGMLVVPAHVLASSRYCKVGWLTRREEGSVHWQVLWGRLQCLWLHGDSSVAGKLICFFPCLHSVVLEVYIISVYPRNQESKGDPLYLQVPFTAQVKFKLTKFVQSDWSSDASVLSRLGVQNTLHSKDAILLAELRFF